MKFEEKVIKTIADAIGDYLKEGRHSCVILEYTTKSGEISGRKCLNVEDGHAYFMEGGFFESGLKSYTKKARINQKLGYVVFETWRIGGALGGLLQDVENIERDAQSKAHD